MVATDGTCVPGWQSRMPCTPQQPGLSAGVWRKSCGRFGTMPGLFRSARLQIDGTTGCRMLQVGSNLCCQGHRFLPKGHRRICNPFDRSTNHSLIRQLGADQFGWDLPKAAFRPFDLLGLPVLGSHFESWPQKVITFDFWVRTGQLSWTLAFLAGICHWSHTESEAFAETSRATNRLKGYVREKLWPRGVQCLRPDTPTKVMLTWLPTGSGDPHVTHGFFEQDLLTPLGWLTHGPEIVSCLA